MRADRQWTFHEIFDLNAGDLYLKFPFGGKKVQLFPYFISPNTLQKCFENNEKSNFS